MVLICLNSWSKSIEKLEFSLTFFRFFTVIKFSNALINYRAKVNIGDKSFSLFQNFKNILQSFIVINFNSQIISSRNQKKYCVI